MTTNRPIVLCFSGHDPSGGAGIQADIETIASHHCHAASVITALTEQDSRNVKKLLPQRPADIISQAETLLNDFKVSSIKIGLLGHQDAALAIQRILQQCPDIPVVLDPVLAAGGGTELASRQLITTITEELLPLTTVLTPNSDEARRLAGVDDLSDCARLLRAKGAQNVLITGTHEHSELVHNRLFMPDNLSETFNWQRLPHQYHGSGCTLASAIAALLAQGLDVFTAVNEAQEFTWQSLAAAYLPGKGQYNPKRLFWMDA
ncbi:MAG: hydroxymethylpyrimidine/phosphomethylpyrimidine kinase [Methylomonas sp.]|jgi:hydroxymethylpyrimidine/phosphomethylpyrimidine kinase|uniref:bifunctional hydroxymethylpyrimidine kinase/phosphomethylpyrimidine kinase n=1 Tax=Methylomonas sp. TaxID=418 RepID=UPI0025D1FA15|nr:hydroxymethylpyrimidine/phosphomethylpyrimidine kinase [Methylomonas sp.]MCK9607142.1 hydroxymethylpyrimidine/phosphomethylpyrimidine kinase [Methylomonas sp.]